MSVYQGRVVVRGLFVALAFFAMVASVPFVEAQAPSPSAGVRLKVLDPARAFDPGSEGILQVSGDYDVRYAAGNPNVDLSGNGSGPTRITFVVMEMPSWVASASVEPPEIWVEPPLTSAAGAQTAFGGVIVRLNISPDAPALQREPFVLEAIAEQNGAIPEARGVSPPLPLRAAEVASANVSGPAGPVVIDGGSWNVVTFQVRNDGNKDTTFLLNLTVRPEMSEVEFPRELQLAVDESVEVPVRIRTPWTERETGTLELEAVPLTEDDEGPASRFAVDVVGESAVPFPSVGLVVVVMVGVAWRRRVLG